MDGKTRILIADDEHKIKVDKIATIIDNLYDEQTSFSDSNKEEVLRYSSAEALDIEINLISIITINNPANL